MVRAPLIQRARRKPSGDAEGCPLADITEGERHISGSLEAQLRDCFGRVAYSHKTHEKSADLLQAKLHRLKTAEIILSAITTTGLITVLFTAPDAARCAAGVTAVFSAALFALTTYTKDFDLGAKSQAHKDAADNLWVIREAFLSLLTDGRLRCPGFYSRLIYRSAPQSMAIPAHKAATVRAGSRHS
jgi:hypothetical protein